MEIKNLRRQKRQLKVRSKISGTNERPRFVVNRTDKHIYGQIINDETGKTLVAASDLKIKKGNNIAKAKEVGLEIAKLAKAKKISKVAFDRRGLKYHGRVKALAEGAREGGLEF